MSLKVKYLFATMTAIAVIVICMVFLIARLNDQIQHKNNTASESIVQYTSDESLSKRDSIVAFAKTLLGTPYQYGTCSPESFDCSGFVYYVFSKFNIAIPRSSYLMAETGKKVDTILAQKGDLIFFKGTDLSDPKIGHVGIIISEKGKPIEFIHASSGKKSNAVIITKFHESNYRKRFVEIKSIIKSE